MAASLPIIARRAAQGEEIVWDTLDGAKINQIFPFNAQKGFHRTHTTINGIQRECGKISATSLQIFQRQFKAGATDQIKTLALHRFEISDEQLGAIVTRFSKIETVILTEIPRITGATLEALQALKGLRIVKISSCPSINTIKALPLERLVELSVQVMGPIEMETVRRLASSRLLRRVDFGNFHRMSAEELLSFQKSPSELVIHVHASPHITPDVISRLNFGRARPIKIEEAISPPPLDGVKTLPQLPEKEGTLIVKGSDKDSDLVRKIDESRDKIRIGSVYGCPSIEYESIISLSLLRELEILYFGKNRGATPRSLEVLFAEEGIWPKLTEVRLFETPLSDRALESLSKLPSLKTLYLVGCVSFSPEGVRKFLRGSRSIKMVAFSGCPAFDPLFIKTLEGASPRIVFRNENQADPMAIRFAEEEARRIMGDKKADRRYFFLAEFLGQSDPLPENIKLGGKTEAVTTFYAEKLAMIGSSIPPQEWMLADQCLQAYVNLRAGWAIVRILIHQGFKEQLPTNLEEVVQLLEVGENRGFVRHFEFEEWGIIDLPPFIYSLDWPKLETIRLKGNRRPRLKQSHFPKLRDVELIS